MTRTARDRRGFSILEVVITLGILLLLVGFGTVTFNIVSGGTYDTAAFQSLDRATFAQRAWLARNATWASDPEVLKLGRGLRATAGPSTGPDSASIAVSDDNTLGVAVLSESGTCLARTVTDPLVDGIQEDFELTSADACTGQAAIAAG